MQETSREFYWFFLSGFWATLCFSATKIPPRWRFRVWLFDDGIKKLRVLSSDSKLEKNDDGKSVQGDFSRRIIKHHQMILEYAFLDDACWLSLTHFFHFFFLLLLSCLTLMLPLLEQQQESVKVLFMMKFSSVRIGKFFRSCGIFLHFCRFSCLYN